MSWTHGRSIFEQFEDVLAKSPNRVLFNWVDEEGRDSRSFTFASFKVRYEGLARYLLSKDGANLAPGDRVALVYSPSLEYNVALVACLRAGIVAAPVQPPDPAHLEHDV